MNIKLITLCFSLFTLGVSAQDDSNSRSYKLDDFENIVTHGGGNINVEFSDASIVEVTTGSDCLESVELKVKAKTLYIEVKDYAGKACKVTINIKVPALNSIAQNGGGNVLIKKGFSPIKSFACKLKGGGNINLSALNIENCYASIEGGGSMLVNATNQLEGKITGGGLIEYLGEPEVISDISGGGAIKKR